MTATATWPTIESNQGNVVLGVCPTCRSADIEATDTEHRYHCLDCDARWTGVRVPLVERTINTAEGDKPVGEVRVGRICGIVNCDNARHHETLKEIDRTADIAYQPA